MKLKNILFLMALTGAVNIQAQPAEVPVRPVPTTPDDGLNPRSPILLPVLYIDGYTLTASDNTMGSTIQLLDEYDNVVFSTYVAIEGEIQLPTTLSSTYTILVIRDDATFEGELEL